MEYKFRGKRVDNDEWVYGGYCKFYVEYDTDESGETVESSPRLGHFIFMRNAIHEEVHPESVGQWTGLKDKNKVDVYLDDIVYSTYDGYYGVIKQLEGGAYYIDQPETCLKYKHQIHCEVCETDSPTFFLSHFEGWEWEVAGNITDNPELLKE